MKKEDAIKEIMNMLVTMQNSNAIIVNSIYTKLQQIDVEPIQAPKGLVKDGKTDK